LELPPFERACLIVKYYETLHINQGNVIGYGHVIQPGEPFRNNLRLTEKQADALMRHDLKKFCAIFREYGSDSLLLGCLSYNVGPQRVLKSNMLRKLRSGNRDIFTDYLSFCHYQGKMHKGIRRRRYVEYKMLYSNCL
jgi:GH24 family phage-related lysozyme (muramidase)